MHILNRVNCVVAFVVVDGVECVCVWGLCGVETTTTTPRAHTKRLTVDLHDSLPCSIFDSTPSPLHPRSSPNTPCTHVCVSVPVLWSPHYIQRLWVSRSLLSRGSSSSQSATEPVASLCAHSAENRVDRLCRSVASWWRARCSPPASALVRRVVSVCWQCVVCVCVSLHVCSSV